MQKCPKCKKKSLVVSVFGSICGNCFYNPNESKHVEHANEKTVCGDCWFEQFETDFRGRRYYKSRHAPTCSRANIKII